MNDSNESIDQQEPSEGGIRAWLASAVLSLFGSLFVALFPSGSRRMVFTASLLTHIKQLDPNSADDPRVIQLLKELNDELHLASQGERALIVPFMLHKWIWSGQEVPTEEKLSDEDVDFSCEYIIRHTPRWLCYDVKNMHKDVNALLQRFVEGREKTSMEAIAAAGA